MTRRKPPPTTCVYFVYCAGFIKIGFATCINNRLGNYASANPHRATALWTVPGDRKLERQYHERFKIARRSGEWFDFSPEIRQFLLEQLSQTVGGKDRMARVEAEFRKWAITATQPCEGYSAGVLGMGS